MTAPKLTAGMDCTGEWGCKNGIHERECTNPPPVPPSPAPKLTEAQRAMLAQAAEGGRFCRNHGRERVAAHALEQKGMVCLYLVDSMTLEMTLTEAGRKAVGK